MYTDNLYSYIFWYNPYEELWYAIHRDSQLLFFNGDRKTIKYYSDTDITELISLVGKLEHLADSSQTLMEMV